MTTVTLLAGEGYDCRQSVLLIVVHADPCFPDTRLLIVVSRGNSCHYTDGLDTDGQLTKLTSLALPVPPNLAEALSYGGAARFVAFYFEPVGDEVMYDDGRITGTADWYPFKLYCEHCTVAPKILHFNFGHSALSAEHWL